jgi:hypothetical protein
MGYQADVPAAQEPTISRLLSEIEKSLNGLSDTVSCTCAVADRLGGEEPSAKGGITQGAPPPGQDARSRLGAIANRLQVTTGQLDTHNNRLCALV